MKKLFFIVILALLTGCAVQPHHHVVTTVSYNSTGDQTVEDPMVRYFFQTLPPSHVTLWYVRRWGYSGYTYWGNPWPGPGWGWYGPRCGAWGCW